MELNGRAKFKEGEDVLLPCRGCGSLELTVTVRASTRTPQCPDCGAFTKVQIQPLVGGHWEIRTALLEGRIRGF